MEIWINKLKAPLSVQFELTYECNNDCLFCYNVWKDPSMAQEWKPRLLSSEEIRQIIQQLKKEGVFRISFTGGEPTLHPDFIEILEFCTSIGMRPDFVTNANRITPEFAQKVKAAGINHVQVSLHGSHRELHETLTQVNGSFEKAIHGIQNLIAQGVKVNVNMTVNKQNMFDMFETASLAKQLGAFSFTFTRFVYSGAGTEQQETLGLLRDDQDALVDMLTRIDRELGFDTRILTPIPFCSIKEPHQVANKMSRCDGGITWCVISPSGQVRTCTNAEEIAGDLKQQSIRDIWQNSPQFMRCQNLEHIPDECTTCEAFFYCGGGCRACATNYSKGDCKAPDPCSNVDNIAKVNEMMPTIVEAMIQRSNRGQLYERLAVFEENMQTMTPQIYGELMVREEGTELLASNGTHYVLVNEVGVEILRQVDGKNKLEQIVDHFAQTFTTMPRNEIASKIVDFLTMATQMRVVTWK